MSRIDRLEWSQKVASLNECIRGFQANPSKEQLDRAISELRAYADAAEGGNMEIPSRFIAS
ncbi:hypothetical protein [Pseudoduganella buxea]|uniref:Uncharacterized protein n=1 Tax=Pseudoduganella buxea TaxID=1949069 RepID=A0A6I3T3J1_9BURK|nr:hypothetical protein [Pseudoduganella buxea]MTV55495.1 hypothetical protein [Pseudoduganella buxea]GGB92773.1 hypothetical protein GCM10011572_13450 [Pseudoduganella buxea]